MVVVCVDFSRSARGVESLIDYARQAPPVVGYLLVVVSCQLPLYRTHGGLLGQIDLDHYNKVHYTKFTNSWVSNPLSGYLEGQFVKCKALEINHTVSSMVHIDLSLWLTTNASNDLNVRFVHWLRIMKLQRKAELGKRQLSMHCRTNQ